VYQSLHIVYFGCFGNGNDLVELLELMTRQFRVGITVLSSPFIYF
jgi:hypothetical protein